MTDQPEDDPAAPVASTTFSQDIQSVEETALGRSEIRLAPAAGRAGCGRPSGRDLSAGRGRGLAIRRGAPQIPC